MKNFIARQPIFNVYREVVAYELLFRNGLKNAFEISMGDTEATSHVLVNSLMLFGMRALTGGNKALVNVTREVLVNDYMQLFPPDLVVPEILETVAEDPEVIAATMRLKKAGFEVALDDVISLEGREGFCKWADIIKVDFMDTNAEMQALIADRFRDTEVALLAEKIETHEEFESAKAMGYTLFQGYFFAKPEVLSKRSVPGDRIHYMRLLRRIHQAELDLDSIEALIKQDLSLSYRLLRYINSAFFGLRVEIRSIKHALVLLGENEIKKWATLVAMAFMGTDKPAELIITALTRARFCETLSDAVGLRPQAQDLFLMGMFSVLDALMDHPLEEVLEDMPISQEIKSALLGDESLYHKILWIVISYERGDWEAFANRIDDVKIPENRLPDMYLAAVDWANQSLAATPSMTPPSS
ncbi:MAG: HDOD domain-containing protein [Myxococcota bacterium]|nr:HDOD domain-containing protein [Myxococcota bacterium]